MIALLIRYWQVGAGMIAGALMASPFVYLYSASITRQVVAVEAMERTISIINDRSIIDDEVNSSDAASLCGSFGLSDDETKQCVRRLQPVNP